MQAAAVLILAGMGLAGCEAAIGPVAAVNGVSLMLAGKAVPDIVYSAVSGRDCSIARLDAGEGYCKPVPGAAPAIWCTRSLGQADCWAAPPPGSLPVADPMLPVARQISSPGRD